MNGLFTSKLHRIRVALRGWPRPVAAALALLCLGACAPQEAAATAASSICADAGEAALPPSSSAPPSAAGVGGAATLPPSPGAPSPGAGEGAAPGPQGEMPVFYDFTLDENGKYASQALFPRPGLLPGLKEEWEARWLSAPAPGEDGEWYDPDFAARVREDGRACGLQWAYTGDFDGDGGEETFFCYGMPTPMRPTVSLYLLQADGGLLALDEAPYFGGWVIRYPGFAHLLISTDYGTGLSLRAEVLVYDGEKVDRQLSVQTAVFEKDGCFLVATPRVGSAGQVEAVCYYWDGDRAAYAQVPCVEIALGELPQGIPAARGDTFKKRLATLWRAATVAKRYYYACYREEGTGEEWLLLYKKGPQGALEKVSGFYNYPLDELLGGAAPGWWQPPRDPPAAPPDGAAPPAIDYERAVAAALPVERAPLIPKAAQEAAIALLEAHVDLEEALGQKEYAILLQPAEREGEPYYLLTVGENTPGAFYSRGAYYVAADFSRILQAGLYGPDTVVWAAAPGLTPQGEG